MEGRVLDEYLYKIRNIDLLAKETIVAQQKRLPEKYANIEATLKLLNNLILNFKSQSQQY